MVYVIFGVLLTAGVIVTLLQGTKEEKQEMKQAIIKLVVIVIIAGVIGFIMVIKPEIITDIVRPGAEVRDAYLTEYSDKVTVEEAFDNYFSDEKWDKYQEKGYSYVSFTGTSLVMEEKADVRIVFKITGSQFQVDRLDINGKEMPDLLLEALLEDIYEEF